MAEQPRRSGSQRKTPANKSAASKSARKQGPAKATGKASSGGTQSKRGSSGSGSASRGSGSASRSSGGSSGSGGSSAGGGRRSSRRDGTSGREAVLQAREQVSELTGRPVESVLGMERDDDGWLITVQMVELARVPNSTDVLGDYAVRVDDNGEVVGYRRMRRYHRGQADEG